VVKPREVGAPGFVPAGCNGTLCEMGEEVKSRRARNRDQGFRLSLVKPSSHHSGGDPVISFPSGARSFWLHSASFSAMTGSGGVVSVVDARVVVKTSPCFKNTPKPRGLGSRPPRAAPFRMDLDMGVMPHWTILDTSEGVLLRFLIIMPRSQPTGGGFSFSFPTSHSLLCVRLRTSFLRFPFFQGRRLSYS